MEWLLANAWWAGPVIHVVATFVVADIVGTILYKKSRHSAWSNIALQVHPLITFLSGLLFIWLWIPCK